MPTPGEFAAAMSRLGISDDTVVVAYDDSGGVTAGRLVVMLRMLGCDAAVLDGGLGSWTGQIDTGWVEPLAAAAAFTPTEWPAGRLATADETQVLAASSDGVALDARSPERFTGEVALIDPRPGHIPGARSAPWTSVIGPDGRFRSPAELRQHFAALGADGDADVVTYCGSGISACMNIVAMEHAGFAPPRLYVASWSGWSSDSERPAATGG